MKELVADPERFKYLSPEAPAKMPDGYSAPLIIEPTCVTARRRREQLLASQRYCTYCDDDAHGPYCHRCGHQTR